MAITWDGTYSTGSIQTDNEHKDLFRQVNLLEEAMKKGQGRDEIDRILDFLADYVGSHFEAEERLMDSVACPAAAANSKAHRDFLAKFGQMRKAYEESGAQTSLVLELHGTLSDWLVSHIKSIDTQLNSCAAKVC